MKRHRYIIRAALIVTLLLMQSSNTALANEPNWPQFRGPGGLGIAPDNQAYPTKLDMSKNLLWKTEVPKGHSSPCIWVNSIFITARSGKVLETICIDRANGQIKWRKSVEPKAMEKINPSNSHASSTPVSDGKRVYVYFGSFGLLAYDFEGKELWKKPLAAPAMQHGTASSPILANGLIVINCDQKTEPYLLAIDQSTGEQVWKIKRPDSKSKWNWSTPVLWKHGDQKELVVLGRERLIAYDPKDGRERWWVSNLPLETAATPVYNGETFYATATALFHGDPVNPPQIPEPNELFQEYDVNRDGRLDAEEVPEDLATLPRLGPHIGSGVKKNFKRYDRNGDGALSKEEWQQIRSGMLRWTGQMKNKDMCLAIRSGGTGDVTESHIQWNNSEGISQVTSPLYYKGHIYTVKFGGIASCFDAQNGKKLFREKLGANGYYFASPVAGDNKVYLSSGKGVVVVIEAGDQFKILAQNKIGERVKATPALVDGKVYLRTANHMMAFGG
ncbi:PQQ-binding-like beta-propeller repeat protein [Planctomycetota bacterium]